MSPTTQMNESCSHRWMSHITHTNDEWHARGVVQSCGERERETERERDRRRERVRANKRERAIKTWRDTPPTHTHISEGLQRDSSICVPWLINMCAMTHSYVWRDSFRCMSWLIHMCDMTRWYLCHDSFMCDMTRSHVWHDSFTCVTWLIHMCVMTHWYVWHDSFMCVMKDSYVWHDSLSCKEPSFLQRALFLGKSPLSYVGFNGKRNIS